MRDVGGRGVFLDGGAMCNRSAFGGLWAVEICVVCCAWNGKWGGVILEGWGREGNCHVMIL
jgi:hypothetical protein